MEQEIWKPVIGIKDGLFDGLYEVSNMGRWKILARAVKDPSGRIRNIKEKITNGIKQHYGYRTVHMSNNGVYDIYFLHVLVAKMFIPNPKNKKTVNHKFGIKNDNRVSQLEWATQQEQIQHAYDVGLHNPLKGEQHGRAKLSDVHIKTLRDCYSTGKYNKSRLAKILSISHQYVGMVLRNDNRKIS